MSFKEQVSIEKNTMVVHLKTDWATRIFDMASEVRLCRDNPVGGWKPWGFDQDYEWETYQIYRSSVEGFRYAHDRDEWCEVGFSPLPFLNATPLKWNIVGVVEHPITWIENAMRNRLHQTDGDGVDALPKTPQDYAKLWVLFTEKIVANATVFRVEDLVANRPAIRFYDVWDIVSKVAEPLGYMQNSYEEYESETPDREFVKPIKSVCSVSVVVAARNNGPYLKDALHSVLNQSRVPMEVIYVDDGSTDNSLEIAKTFKDVKVISKPRTGVCDSRNMGAKEAKGDYLLYLDGDDILPYWYIEYRLRALSENPTASFAYGNAQAFGGGFNQFWTCPEWSPRTLWASNFCNTPSLMRRDHFWDIGGWREGIGTAWDWDLYTRYGKAGFSGVYDKNAFLLYRHHEKSISAHQNLKDEKTSVDAVTRMNYLCRNMFCRTQIGAVVSDRLIGLFPKWLDAIVENIEEYRQALFEEEMFPHFGKPHYNKPCLNILFTGDIKHRSFINDQINRVADHFYSVKLCCEQWINVFSTEEERRSNVARFLAKSYNQLLQTDCELVWFLEDDVIPPSNAMKDLNKAITAAVLPLPAVAGVYRNRHDPSHIIAHEWPNLKKTESIIDLTDFPKKDKYVDMTGTGCLMIFRPYASHKFESHYKGIPAHDWNWCIKLKNSDLPQVKKKVLLLSSVQCRHYQTLETYI